MERRADEIIFISRIKRDGSGVEPVRNADKVGRFALTCLSISHKTYIASGFNSFVVKLKENGN